jgi:MoaA/NifB/PqqE/SkfB family radical SAM enzyme
MQELRAPLLVTLEITGECNLFCAYCHLNTRPGPSQHIQLSYISNIVTECKDYGIFDINITGGEPLLHPNFIEIVELVHSSAIEISLNSNGTMITSDIAKKLKNLDIIKNTQISIDSHVPKIHELSRTNFKDTFSGFLTLVGMADKGEEPIVGIVLNKFNFDSIPDTIKYFSQYTNRFHLMNILKCPQLALNNENKQYFSSVILPRLKYLSDNEGIAISQFRNIPKNFSLQDAHIDCLAGYTFITVTPTLDIIPCDMAYMPGIKYKKYGDLINGYGILKNQWKKRSEIWCIN